MDVLCYFEFHKLWNFGLFIDLIKFKISPRFEKWCFNKWSWCNISLLFI